MFRKFNTPTMAIIFVVLLAVVLIVIFLDNKQGTRTFKSEIANVDTATVNSILVYPQSDNKKEIKLMRTGVQWKAQNDKMNVEADISNVNSVLAMLGVLKPIRLAATSKDKWKEYNVDDSLGSRVVLMNNQNKLLDLIVGKFTFNQASRTGLTYVRLNEDENVYVVEGFISMTVNQQFNQWRNKTVIQGNKSDWTKIVFHYPADSGFVLSKTGEKWMLNDSLADSVKVDQYFNQIASATNSTFVDGFKNNGRQAEKILRIEGNNMPAPIVVNVYSDATHKYVLQSSLNTEGSFGDADSSLTQRIFKSKSNFLP